MPKLDAAKTRCFVFTFKEGLLSPVAHDLKLRVERFEVDVTAPQATAGPHVSARFETRSIRVVCAMKDGRDAPGSLSDKDTADIHDNIASSVLDARRHPQILFESTSIEPVSAGFVVRGNLTLQGRPRPVRFEARKQGDWLVADIPIHQPDWGIKPFSALLGTIRIKADVTVRVELAADVVGI